MKVEIVAVMTVVQALLYAQGRPSDDAFVVVSGPHYEGAIVPAASPWQKVVWNPMALRTSLGSEVIDVWTPTAPQVAAAERALEAFVGALRRVNSASAQSQFDRWRLAGDIRSLAPETLPILKRQYAGVVVRGARKLILVHGFPDHDDKRWQPEAVVIMGGGCRQFWMSFSVEQERVEEIHCGSSE